MIKAFGVLYIILTILTISGVLYLEKEIIKKEIKKDKINILKIIGKIVMVLPIVPVLAVLYFFENEY